MSIFFRATPDTEGKPTEVFAGIPNGLNDVDALQYNGGPQFQSRIGALFYESSITTKGISIAKGVIMTYSELQFLLAEATEKGLISGDAATYYNNGVNGSFSFYGLTAPAGYFDLPQVSYTGDATAKLNKIGYQKMDFFVFSRYGSMVRLASYGYPCTDTWRIQSNNNLIPVRFRYPVIEQSLNAEGYKGAVSRQGADDLNSKMWYLK